MNLECLLNIQYFDTQKNPPKNNLLTYLTASVPNFC